MTISLTTLIIWLFIAAIVGFVGELIAHRRAPGGIIGAIVLGLLAILLIVGILHFHIPGEPIWYGVPLISSIIVAAIMAGVAMPIIAFGLTIRATITVVAHMHAAHDGDSACSSKPQWKEAWPVIRY